MKQIYMAALAAALALPVAADEVKEEKAKVDYRPVIHGTVRAKYEYQPEEKAGRFQVRTARVSLEGKVAPVVAYKAEIDLSDEGQIKMLDAYTRITPLKNFDFTIGQMRVPFTIASKWATCATWVPRWPTKSAANCPSPSKPVCSTVRG